MYPYRCLNPECDHFRVPFYSTQHSGEAHCPVCQGDSIRLEEIHLVVSDPKGDIHSPRDTGYYRVLCGAKPAQRYTNVFEAATCKACIDMTKKEREAA